jgi:hypothetical protein
MSTQRLPPSDPYEYTPPPGALTRPLGPWQKYTSRWYLLFHLRFTLRLIGRCLGDPRVSPARKMLFVGSISFLLLLLLVPEAGADLLAAFVPVLDLIGIPFEGVMDWGFFALAAGTLMQLFPPAVIQQHIWELRDGNP